MGLRAGWESAVDSASGNTYYFNRSSGETSWTPPPPIAHSTESAAILIQKIYRAKQARARLQTMMHSIYQRIFDPTTQAYFYHNVKTGETSWMTPRGLKIKPKTSPNEGSSSEEPESPLPPGWSEAFDNATQHTYYVNEATKETSWTRPQASPSWKPFVMDEDEAATLLQAAWRGRRDRDRVRQELLERFVPVIDPTTGATTYLDKQTKLSLAARPNFPQTPSNRAILAAPTTAMPKEEMYGSESSRRSFRIGQRTYPRSKGQLIVDAAEDLELEDIPVTELDMSRLQAIKLTSRIWNLDNLQRLLLHENRLTRIPSGIQDLTKLVYLNVSHNALATLPSGLQTTKTLQHLDASHNVIATFSPRLWKLGNLTHLDLSHNKLVELPYVEGDLKLLKETGAWGVGIGLLSKLHTLKLQHNLLRAWPSMLESCMALRTLDLSENALTELSADVGNLSQLESLVLHHNQLSRLPDTLGLLGELQMLDVSHNLLNDVPASIADCTQLSILNLTHNALASLPEATKALVTLTRLLLSENPFVAFPNHFADMLALTTLTMASCNIPALPEGFWTFAKTQLPSLSSVDLSHNSIQFLPTKGLTRLRSVLTTLRLSHNALEALEPLVCTCHRLTELSLSHNALSTLPDEVAGLKALEILDVSYNQLQALPETVTNLAKLKSLRANHNQLHALPKLVGRLTLLEYLDVSHNALTHLPSTVHELRRLMYLSAASNQLVLRPPYLQHHVETFVDLSNNPFETIDSDYHAYMTAVYKAKADVDRGEYASAHALFSELLYDTKLRPYDLLPPTHQHIRTVAVFYRGICRYQQIMAALRELERVSQEAADVARVVHEDTLLHSISRRIGEKPRTVPLRSPDAVRDAQDQIAKLVAQKGQLRTDIAVWRDDAVRDLKTALRLRMEPRTSSYTLALLYAKLGEYPNAVQMWTTAMSYVPTARNAMTDGDDSETVTAALVPLLLHRARAYAAMGQIPRALVDYRRILAVFPDDADAQLELYEWSEHHRKFHEPCGVDSDELLRAVDVDVGTGIGRRRHDPAVAALPALNEIDSAAAFREACQRLRDAAATAHVQTIQAEKAAKASRDAAVTLVLDRKREIRANLDMQSEEVDQRKRDAAIARALYMLQQERAREENERTWMGYEEDVQRWTEREQARLLQEELDALEAARRKAEEKAELKKRMARRGGLRQASSTRGKK
ncbi:hypothetical protein SPRG_12529 [Saprolegnia parasitica CBS 223.65]|uniref:WW domain-containing protein n=1 Tax=Saprolegnia parasitica (strain CBS 223.65) TaxID=695850 RepID=A0A067C4J7_SAPPC|nr:hypothetical protein SPRG_12529 [Saprolegnia parasitica CBS 223.65]KDO21486.1 hypothetical protein SPRG_12529 [Saprolegnia parasitica CBS 223.65]|eukprot:XP_012207830.1 hypothetical protein SPRG_12529 [Saprolegnia parasitica CBS 223.65]